MQGLEVKIWVLYFSLILREMGVFDEANPKRPLSDACLENFHRFIFTIVTCNLYPPSQKRTILTCAFTPQKFLKIVAGFQLR